MRHISDDNQLMRQVQNGDSRAFEQLVLKYRADTIGFAFRFVMDMHAAEDLVQESFASIYVHRQDYKPTHEFKPFLYAVVRNKCIDFLRKNKNVTTIDLADIELASSESCPEQFIQQQEELNHSVEILKKLNSDYRTALFLYEVDGFSYKEISEIMGKSLPQIKIILYRARKALQKFTKEEPNET